MERLLFLALALLLLALYACECEPLEPTVPPAPDTFVVTDTSSDKFIIFLSFNRPVDFNSLVPGETILVEGGEAHDVYSYDNNISSTQIAITVLVNTCTGRCPVTLTLLAENNTGVRSSEGESLDGDYDGTPGGNF